MLASSRPRSARPTGDVGVSVGTAARRAAGRRHEQRVLRARVRQPAVFYHESADGHTVYTAQSHDIVVHETTHAILDGLAPDLYHAITPESLALHEAVADLSAISQVLLNEMVLFSLEALTAATWSSSTRSRGWRRRFGADLRRSQGASFLRPDAQSSHAESRGRGRGRVWRRQSDRMRPVHTRCPRRSRVRCSTCSCVAWRRPSATAAGRPRSTRRSARARRVARIVFRALDYLPPGDVSFADYGRAFVAAAASTYARPQKEQAWLTQELLDRHVIAAEDELRPRRSHSTSGMRASRPSDATIGRRAALSSATGRRWGFPAAIRVLPGWSRRGRWVRV